MVQEDLPSKNQVDKALVTLKKCEKENGLMMLNENNRVVLQVCQKYIPIKSQQLFHIVLPHPHLLVDEDICLFVKDCDKNNREYEATIETFKDLLAKHNIHNRIEIFPLKKLKLEYNDYESKRRLSNSFEIFLADARIFRLLPELLGKQFISRKKYLTKVNLQANDLKKEFDKASRTVHVCMRGHGPISQCTVGYLDQPSVELVDNITEAIKTISSKIEYGFKNIRSIYIKTNNSLAIPLHLSTNGLDTSIVEENELQVACNPKILEGEVSTLLNGKVQIGKDGRVIIIYNDSSINVVANTVNLLVTETPAKRLRIKKELINLSTNVDLDNRIPRDNKKSAAKKIKLMVEPVLNSEGTVSRKKKKADAMLDSGASAKKKAKLGGGKVLDKKTTKNGALTLNDSMDRKMRSDVKKALK